MGAAVQSTGARRGAMMATLRCDHPDIEAFVAAKRRPGALTHFNLSVLVTDGFLRAVDADTEWPLVFPAEVAGRHMLRAVRARALWESIVRAAYECAEPGVIFIDRVRALDNLGYAERISATNPCGEIPLPPYGACDLGSLNLTRFVTAPFTPEARLDVAALEATAQVAVRMLDNVYDVSGFPLPQQAQTARASRRLGLGITGLADALIMLGLRYDGEAARRVAADAMRSVTEAAYWASVEIARDKGSFPLFDRDRYLAAPFVHALPSELQAAIARDGIRNSHLTAIAPAGTISLLAGNVSSGIEPVYALSYRAPRPAGGRHHRERAGRVSCAGGVRPPEWRRRPAAGVLCHRRRHRPRRAAGNAGRAAGARRQRDREDGQRAGRHPLCRFRGDLPARLRAGPQGVHRLSPERGDRRGIVGGSDGRALLRSSRRGLTDAAALRSPLPGRRGEDRMPAA